MGAARADLFSGLTAARHGIFLLTEAAEDHSRDQGNRVIGGGLSWQRRGSGVGSLLSDVAQDEAEMDSVAIQKLSGQAY